MEQEKNISREEGYEIIQRMLRTARHEVDNNSFYFLLWGWLVLAASVGHFILGKAGFDYPYITWALMPVGGIITAVYAMKHEKHKKVRSYVDQLMSYVLIAFLVSLVIVLAFMSVLQLYTYPIVMVIYGIWLFVSGGALRFRPLVIGGVINWGCAVAAFFVAFEMQLLLLSFAVLTGYIIPGYMLNGQWARKKNAIG